MAEVTPKPSTASVTEDLKDVILAQAQARLESQRILKPAQTAQQVSGSV